MTTYAAVPLLASLLMTVTSTRLARDLPPATATRLLTLGSLLCAITTGFVVAVAAFTIAATVPGVAAAEHWSLTILRHDDPLPPAAALVPAAILLGLLASAILRTAQLAREMATASAAARSLGVDASGLTIVQDDLPLAYTVAGLTARIVISTGMLRALPPEERRVLLAHEESHRRHHHHLYVQAVLVAAAANPLLRPTTGAVRMAVERWADEDAVVTTGDRTVAARALARAALAGRAVRSPRPAAMLAATTEAVPARVQALLRPAPRRRPAATAMLLMLIATTATAGIATERVTERLFEQAHHAYAQVGQPVPQPGPPAAGTTDGARSSPGTSSRSRARTRKSTSATIAVTAWTS